LKQEIQFEKVMSESIGPWLMNSSSVLRDHAVSADLRNILGVDVWAVTSHAAVLEVERGIDCGEHRKLSFLNAHGGNIAYGDAEYRSILKQFTVLSDGIGLDLGAHILYGSVFPDNLNGTDFIPRLFDGISGSRTVALLGARPGVAEAAAQEFSNDHPKHTFTVISDGYFDKDREREILTRLERERPDILLVALGNPTQEKWIAKNCDGRHAGVSIGVGALFDFASGSVPRAPDLMIDLRIEWLYRLWLEPRRMWRRYVLGNPLFVARILRQKLFGPAIWSTP
jgi:exopolysaccharide biosynthesis WecB/TagA/CpsF family protein